MLVALVFTQACAAVLPHAVYPSGDPLAPHASYSPADDGAHPSAEGAYFEWWYYDANFEDGTSATVALYASLMFVGDRSPGVLVNLLDAQGQGRTSYQRLGPEALKLGGPGEISVAESSARPQPDGSVRVVASGKNADGVPLAVDLTFTPTMPGFKHGTGEVRFDGKVALGWVVPMPRANVAGKVSVGGVERAVRGAGYHDHNWGELNLLDTMGYWYWGRLTSPETTVVYASVHFREKFGLPPMRMMAVGDAQRLRSVEVPSDFAPQKEAFLEAANRDIPAGLAIKAPNTQVQLDSLKTVEAMDFTGQAPWYMRPFVRAVTRPAYVRQLCGYKLDTHVEGMPASTSGQGIAEYMYVYQK